jgi:hypothetical protein
MYLFNTFDLPREFSGHRQRAPIPRTLNRLAGRRGNIVRNDRNARNDGTFSPGRSFQSHRRPTVKEEDGTQVRVVCGSYRGTSGPVEQVAAEPIYLDVSVRAGWADTSPPAEADNRTLVLIDRGDEVSAQAGDVGVRFLMVSGKPLEEPVAWYGPIVMNTQAQLLQAFEELEAETFLIRHRGTSESAIRKILRGVRQRRHGEQHSPQSSAFLSRSALAMTDTELKLIAALAIIGFIRSPTKG